MSSNHENAPPVGEWHSIENASLACGINSNMVDEKVTENKGSILEQLIRTDPNIAEEVGFMAACMNTRKKTWKKRDGTIDLDRKISD